MWLNKEQDECLQKIYEKTVASKLELGKKFPRAILYVQQKKLGILSGGERNRVHLAITLREGGNVLLLDEPTNDIDINTLRALEDALEDFAGCVLVISHDRWFIDRLATHILSFEDEANVVFFEGNYSDYEKNKKERLGDITPRRPRFKNIIS